MWILWRFHFVAFRKNAIIPLAFTGLVFLINIARKALKSWKWKISSSCDNKNANGKKSHKSHESRRRQGSESKYYRHNRWWKFHRANSEKEKKVRMNSNAAQTTNFQDKETGIKSPKNNQLALSEVWWNLWKRAYFTQPIYVKWMIRPLSSHT